MVALVIKAMRGGEQETICASGGENLGLGDGGGDLAGGGGGCVQVNVNVVVFGSFSGSQLPSSLWKERGRIEVAGALP